MIDKDTQCGDLFEEDGLIKRCILSVDHIDLTEEHAGREISYTLGDEELTPYELHDGEIVLAPGTMNKSTLSGSEPEEYVALGLSLIVYALSGAAGDWDSERDQDHVARWLDTLGVWRFEGRE